MTIRGRGWWERGEIRSFFFLWGRESEKMGKARERGRCDEETGSAAMTETATATETATEGGGSKSESVRGGWFLRNVRVAILAEKDARWHVSWRARGPRRRSCCS